jgi:glutathionyl-hydroquinone reductase
MQKVIIHQKSLLNNQKGAFQRKDTSFRNKVTADGSSGYKAESGRYQTDRNNLVKIH